MTIAQLFCSDCKSKEQARALREQSVAQAHGASAPLAGALSAEEQSNLLEMVGLEELAGRKDIDWGSLTFGEKQRLSLLRIFYHKPRYAVIDEATAGLGLRTERRIFERCRAMGIALVVVAQQRSLLLWYMVRSYHTCLIGVLF